MKIKFLKILVVIGSLALLAGCVVESVYPYYTAKDLAFEPALLGRWSENVTNVNKFWEFQQAGKLTYALTTIDGDGTNCFDAHFFRLKQYQFLDLCSTNDDILKLPLHLVMKISQINPTLKVSLLDYDWLTKLVEKNPDAIRHIVVPENEDDTNSNKMIYLTADTKELQKFILKYVNDTNAFSSFEELQKISP
jgi:hypothetical protein